MNPQAIVGMIDIFWLMLATALTAGLLIILSALVTGYLVFRTKRESKDSLFPAKDAPRKHRPIVVDDLARDEAIPVSKEADEGLPDVIKRINERFTAAQAVTALKERKRDAA